MMLKFARTFALALSVALSPVTATQAIEVQKLTYHDLDSWLGKSGRPAAKHFTNTTLLINVTSRGSGGMVGAPPKGPLIMYLGKGGKMLSWTPKSKAVGTGTWGIKDMGMGIQIPCFYFDLPKGKSDCFFGGTANYLQTTPGNPFGLEAGAPVPAKMSSSSTIVSLAKKLGL